MIRSFTVIAALLFAMPAVAIDAPEPLKATPKPFSYTPKPTDVVIGKADAPVTIVEYASLSCPHCAHFYTQVLPELTAKYIETGKARLVYRDYPLNEPALKAAELIQCADPDRRKAFLKVLFTTQTKWAYDSGFKDALANIASFGGMERARFDTCMNDKAIEKEVAEVRKEAEDAYKVSSTPTLFIQNKRVEGDHSVSALGKAINEALAGSAGR